MSKKAEELLLKQQTLATQLRDYQRAQAQTAYSQGQRALQQQLRMSRMEADKSRSQLSEQAYLTNRSINQGAQARGLGNSGLKNLALVQSQMAQGRGVTEMQRSLDAVQREVAGTRLGLAEQLANANQGAQVTMNQNLIDADKYAIGLDQEKTNQLLQLYQMALESGGTADIKGIASILGLDLDSLTPEQQEALSLAAGDPFGDIKIKNKLGVDWARVAGSAAVGAGVGTAISPVLGTAIGGLGLGTMELFRQALDGVTISSPAGEKSYDSWQQALIDIDRQYVEKLSGYKEAGIKAVRVGENVKFDYNGTKYNTANEALAAWKKYGSGK